MQRLRAVCIELLNESCPLAIEDYSTVSLGSLVNTMQQEVEAGRLEARTVSCQALPGECPKAASMYTELNACFYGFDHSRTVPSVLPLFLDAIVLRLSEAPYSVGYFRLLHTVFASSKSSVSAFLHALQVGRLLSRINIHFNALLCFARSCRSR
jgi:hypothetical protein